MITNIPLSVTAAASDSTVKLHSIVSYGDCLRETLHQELNATGVAEYIDFGLVKDQLQRFLFVEVNVSTSVFNINKSI